MTNHDKERDIQSAIITILSSLRRAMRFAMEQNNVPLSPLYFIMLKLIHDNDRCTALQLAHLSGRDKGQITRLIKELETQGLILKRQNQEDKRSFFLELSNQGRACFSELEQYDLEALHAMTQGIDEQQLTQFLATAERMAINLSQYPNQIRD